MTTDPIVRNSLTTPLEARYATSDSPTMNKLITSANFVDVPNEFSKNFTKFSKTGKTELTAKSQDYAVGKWRHDNTKYYTSY